MEITCSSVGFSSVTAVRDRGVSIARPWLMVLGLQP